MTDCRVLVLGGSSGIGLAFARLAAREDGIDVEVTAPSPETAADARIALDGKVGVHVIDLLDDVAETSRALTVLVESTDVLVLSAGLEYVGPVEHEAAGDFERMLAVNASGPALAARACLPAMIGRGSGLIVGLGSIVTAGPRPFLAAYVASKAAFELYLRSLAGEVQDTGVRVEILRLGPVATELGSNGPANWIPDPTSPYHAPFLAAREDSESERTELIRTPTDVAEEILGLVCSFRDSQLRS